MTELPITGDVHTALGHLTPLGIASILRDNADPAATFHWDKETVCAIVTTHLTVIQIGETIRAHAQARAEQSWIAAKIKSGPRKGASLFAPRVAGPKDHQDWVSYEMERAEWLGNHGDEMSDLDHAMMGGLGEPAWWNWSPRESQPDQGASRWEMKTRNQGQEFLGHRLLPLTDIVAKRSADAIVAGLVGQSLVDDKGSGEASLTGTGLVAPRPVDSAVAYCALYGLAALPVVRRLGGVSDSAGMVPRARTHPRHAFLPILVRPSSPRKFRSVVSSAHFDAAGQALVSEELREAPEEGYLGGWLKEQGVFAVLICEIEKAGSASAPERRILDGRIRLL